MTPISEPKTEFVPSSNYSFYRLVLYFIRLGATGFGGPVALTNYMERDLVENRRWISMEEFVEGVALAQLAPGPLATQLAIYLGWVRGRIFGATVVGLAFILPSFVICMALAIAYIYFGSLNWIQNVFYSVGASVIGIIVFSAFKLVRKTVGQDKLLWVIWVCSAGLTALTESEMVLVFLASGIVSLLVKAPPAFFNSMKSFYVIPAWLIAGLHGPSDTKTLLNMAAYFAKAGAFVFGSGLTIVPFLHGGVVQEFHWLNERQFIDAVAVGMITPGPVVITVVFIGYLVAGTAGAFVAAGGTFLPCYLLTVIPAPYFSRYAKNPHIKAFVQGVTAATIGAIAGAAWVLGKHAIVDIPTFLIGAVTLGLVAKTKIPEPVIIAVAVVVGLVSKAV